MNLVITSRSNKFNFEKIFRRPEALNYEIETQFSVALFRCLFGFV